MQNQFTLFLRGITVLAVAMLMIPLNLLLLAGTFPNAQWIVPPATIFFVFLGYFMQSVYSSFLGKRYSNDGMAYDVHTFNQYHYKHAVFPILISACLGVLLCVITIPWMEEYLYEEYVEALYRGEENAYFVKESLVPYTLAVLSFLSSMAGIIIWFYPPARLNSLYTLIWAGAVLLIEFLLLIFSGGLAAISGMQAVFIVCLSIFSICITILYNQGMLESPYKTSIVSVFKTEDRVYNLFLVLVLFGVLLLVLGISFIMVTGLYHLGYAIVWFILYWVIYAGAQDNPQKQYEMVEFAEDKIQKEEAGTAGNWIGIMIGLVSVLMLLVITWRSGLLKKFFRLLYTWFMEVFGALLQKRNPGAEEDDYIVQSYVDEIRKTQNAFIREYEIKAESIRTYKEFTQQLSRLPDVSAQLCFAYAVLVRMYRTGNVNLKTSDTPREVEYKVLRAVSGEEIKPITAAFETIRYREKELSVEEAEPILRSMCEIIHRYMA